MVPPNHPLKNRVFQYKPSILGYPYFWKHPHLAEGVHETKTPSTELKKYSKRPILLEMHPKFSRFHSGYLGKSFSNSLSQFEVSIIKSSLHHLNQKAYNLFGARDSFVFVTNVGSKTVSVAEILQIMSVIGFFFTPMDFTN